MDQTTTNKERAVSLNEEMYVTKRDGKREIVSFDKILNRIKKIGQEAHMKLNYTTLVMKVIDQLYDGISTTKIDELSAEQCASMASIHPDYNVLAGSIIISNHHSNTLSSFVEVMTQLYNFKDKHGKQSPLISEETFQHIINNADIFDEMCCYNRDYLIDYFGFKTLERAYLMKINNKIVERIQHMWLRVSIGIHGDNMDRIKETYDLMSQKYFTHATPTLFNSGTPRPQNSSCFLLAMESDSIEGIYNTLKDCALISKWAGGIGLHIHNVRASGSHIRGTNGSSNGIVPMLKVFNNTAKYVDQCLDPETLVYTKRGVIPIKSIMIGDEVVTDDGNFYEIGKVLDNQYTGDFYTLEVQDSSGPIKMTDMHPLWCIQNPDNQDGYHMKNMLDKKMIAPDFIEVKNINKNDYIGFPIPKYEKDISEYTEDDCYFYGIFINSIVHQNAFINSKSDDPSIKLYIPMLKTKIIQFVEDYLNSYAIPFKNRNEKMVFTSFGMQNLLIFEWERCNRFKFTYEMFYEGVPALLHLPKPKLLKLIQGVLELKISSINENYYVINNVKGSNIFDHLRYMLLRLGVLTSGDNTILNIPLNAVNRILQIDVTLPYKPNDYFQYNDTLFSKVTKNTFITNYSGRVIDIEVDNADHHNFLTQNGLVKNGGGKRNGSFAIYLEPWHADIEIFLQMRKNHGDEELKARDLFYALWIPDLFMDRVKADGQWTLMCPDECPGLSDVYGDAFVELYTKYEQEGKGRTTVKARDLWFQVLDAQMETGTPYLVYKDAANKKSNQQNVGTIKSSNLCSEIIQYSDAEETAVCNLASLSLPSFIDTTDPKNPIIDYEKLHEVTKVITYNLNQIIDVNYYPTEKTRRSNMRHRPIGIGVQGLADVFMLLNLPFTSDEAKKINHRIFETIYHGAVEQSCQMALQYGHYETFEGSPASEGKLQFDLWNVSPTLPGEKPRYDWDNLKKYVQMYGLRNSLLLAPMPTASTSQILGNNECIEPITSNIYNRRTIAGEFILANKYLMKDLIQLDLWNEKVKNNIIANNGSVQHIEAIPLEIREKYKTVWEIPMRTLIDMAADRGAFVCQSQSLNLWLEDPNYNMLTSMHFYAWSKGLKTGIYYLRRRGRHQAQQFTIEPEKKNLGGGQIYEEDEVCEMCSA